MSWINDKKHNYLLRCRELRVNATDAEQIIWNYEILNNLITPYQVTWDNTSARHEKALDAFYEAFPMAEDPIFITKENAEAFLNT